MEKRFHAIIIGKVQGVFFRATACKEAMELGIKGFVRNLSDGSVELEAEGEEAALKVLLGWCHQGPPGARVEKVNIAWKQPQQLSGDFSVK